MSRKICEWNYRAPTSVITKGVVNAASEVVPGHLHLNALADAVKAGVRMAGGTPLQFPAIAVCDGLAMNHEGMRYSLASREVIADSIEIMAKAHAFDGLVMIPNCDKIVPGMLMAAARLNIPAIVMSGGPMLAGRYEGRDVSVSTMFEAAGLWFLNALLSERTPTTPVFDQNPACIRTNHQPLRGSGCRHVKHPRRLLLILPWHRHMPHAG